jgi:hypothetical protein
MSLFGKDFLKEGADSGKVSLNHTRFYCLTNSNQRRDEFRAILKVAVNFTLTSMPEKEITVALGHRATVCRVDTLEVMIDGGVNILKICNLQ